MSTEINEVKNDSKCCLESLILDADTINDYMANESIDDDCYDVTEPNTEPNTTKKIYLTDNELDDMNLRAEKVKVFDKEEEIIQLKNIIIDTQIKLLEESIQSIKKDKIILGYQLLETRNTREDFRSYSKEQLMRISENHNIINQKWGYDARSGEIIINTDKDESQCRE